MFSVSLFWATRKQEWSLLSSGCDTGVSWLFNVTCCLLPVLALISPNSKQNTAKLKISFKNLSHYPWDSKQDLDRTHTRFFNSFAPRKPYCLSDAAVVLFSILPQSLPPSGPRHHHLPSTSMLITTYLSFVVRLGPKMHFESWTNFIEHDQITLHVLN